MKQEYSYGAVVYKKENNRLYILIEYMKQGHVSMPKGHIEEGETKEECVLREIKEETNLVVSLDTSFSYTITYSPYPDIIKDVTFYLATPLTNHIKPQEEEVSRIDFLPAENALALLTHETDKDVLKSALNHLKEKGIY